MFAGYIFLDLSMLQVIPSVVQINAQGRFFVLDILNPNSQILVGLHVYMQSAAFNSTPTHPQRFELSNGLKVTVCSK